MTIEVTALAPRGEHLLDERLKDETLSSLMEPTWLITEEGQGMISGPEDVMEENLSDYITAKENEAHQLNELYNFMLKNANKMGESLPGYLNRHHKNEMAQENYNLFLQKYNQDMQNFENFGEEKDAPNFLENFDELKQQKNTLNRIGNDRLEGIPSGEYTRLANGGPTSGYGELLPYEPSPLEKQRQGLASFIMKHAPKEGFLSSYKNPYQANQLAENLTFMSEFIPGFGDAQTFREGQFMIDEGDRVTGGVMMGASMLPFLPGTPIAKLANKLQEKIKKAKFDEQREMRNALSGDGGPAYDAADRHRKSWQKNQRKLDEMVAKEKARVKELEISKKEIPPAVQNEFNFKMPVGRDAGEELAIKLSKNPLYHGSQRKGIETLLLPEDLTKLRKGQRYPSAGGIYTLINPRDPRLKYFSEKGSVYSLTPNLKRTLDVENMPQTVRSQLDNLSQYVSRPSRAGIDPKRIEYQINTMLEGGPGSVNKTPSQFSPGVAQVFKDLEYDSVLFPPRKMTGEAETLLSLDPSNLTIADELSFDDLIRTLLDD